MTNAVFIAYAAGHLALFAWALRLFLTRRTPSTAPLLLVTFGLVYGNLMLGLGASVGEGELLRNLSVPRFFLHAFVTPLLMLSALGLARRAGVRWAGGSAAAAMVSLLAVAAVAIGVYADMILLQLDPGVRAGVVSYGNAGGLRPPPAPIVTILVVLAFGLAIWRKARWPWLFAGAALQFVAAAIGDRLVLAGNLGELALLAGFVATDARLRAAGAVEQQRAEASA